MKATVAEVFQTYQKADEKSWNAAVAGKFDGDATVAMGVLSQVLWKCCAPLDLDGKQAVALQKYRQPVPEKA